MLTRLPLVLLLLIVVAAHADAPESRVALVIGNSAYVHTAALPNPRADAAAMAAKLRGLGFTVLDGYDRDHAQTRELLRRFADAAATADVALFYYGNFSITHGTVAPARARSRTISDSGGMTPCCSIRSTR